ncbi:MAG: hypothetical protein J5858_10490, partial [Lentisphaeria bacterium]|nr:hypothetical protein [Lentisphaeria bacterium]
MIEAKGMRDGASFNYAQLAKEYLIARQECRARNIAKPRILLLLTDEQKSKIQKTGLICLFRESWNQLQSGKAVKGQWSDGKVKFFQKHSNMLKDSPNDDEIIGCFKMLSFERLKEISDHYETQDASSRELAAMISKSIAWHMPKNHCDSAEIPIWSKMLMNLAKTPLYEFYTGGTINDTVCKAEEDFFKNAFVSSEHPIRKAVESIRNTLRAHREKIEKYYQLYRIQKYWDLKNESAKGISSDTVRLNCQYFDEKFSQEERNLEANQCKMELNREFDNLNNRFAKKYGDGTGIYPSSVPNVRSLIYFYFRSLLDWNEDIPGYKYFSFDNKPFFAKKN